MKFAYHKRALIHLHKATKHQEMAMKLIAKAEAEKPKKDIVKKKSARK